MIQTERTSDTGPAAQGKACVYGEARRSFIFGLVHAGHL